MTPEQLEAGYGRRPAAVRRLEIDLRRSLGLPGALKRLAYNVAWMRIDPLWVAIVRAGLMPFATRIFERMLRLRTKDAKPGPGVPPIPAQCAKQNELDLPLVQP